MKCVILKGVLPINNCKQTLLQQCLGGWVALWCSVVQKLFQGEGLF